MKIKNLSILLISSVFLFSCAQKTQEKISEKSSDLSIKSTLYISESSGVSERKNKFFKTLIPIIKKENSKINAKRTLIKKAISNKNFEKIYPIAAEFKVKRDQENWAYELLSRVDEVPLNIAIAQAAYQSFWGLSRFTKEGNALFGEKCYQKGCGIIPKNRPKGKKYEIKSFKNISKSIENYLYNLNTNVAYADFRLTRKRMRESGISALNTNRLAEDLSPYAANDYNYISNIKKIIDYNKENIKNVSLALALN